MITQRTELDFQFYGNYRPWPPEEFFAVKNWIDENCSNVRVEEKWNHSDIADDDEFMGAIFMFANKEDAMRFKLTWMGECDS